VRNRLLHPRGQTDRGRRSSQLSRMLGLLTAIALVAAACGSGSGGEPTETTQPTTAAPGDDSGSTTTASETGGDGEGQSTLEFIYPNFGGGSEDAANLAAETFMDAYPDVEVVPISVAADSWGTFFANTATVIAGGASPDLIHVPTEAIEFLRVNELAIPITPYMENDPDMEATLADIAPGILDGVTASNGDLYFIPQGWNNMVMYYNTARFEEAGVEFPSEDWTWEEFKETARALSDPENGQYGYAWQDVGLFVTLAPWIANTGGNLLDACEATLDTPEMHEVVTFMKGLLDEGISPTPMSAGDIFTRFMTGEVAMFGAGLWPMGTFAEPGFEDYDVTRWPTGSTYQTVLGGDGFAIMTTSDQPDLAWEFAKFSVTPEVQANRPPGGSVALRSVAEERAAATDVPANMELFYRSVEEFPVFNPFPAPPLYSEFEGVVTRHLQLIFGGEVSVEEGLANMQAEAVTCE
jgi:multiple sugar transport system substrate-binding protein